MLILKNIKKGIVWVVLFQSCSTPTEKQIIQNEDTSSFEIEVSTPSLLKDTFFNDLRVFSA